MPTQTFCMWNGVTNNKTFKADNVYYEIPYSQLTQVDEIVFLNKLSSATDFYQNGDVGGKSCPRYGVDCSGYVSFAFGIERMTTSSMITALQNNSGKIIKVGDYNPKSLKKTEVFAAYAILEASNAMVHNGHARLVLSNDVSSEQIVVYETNNTLPVVSIYTYDDLWKDRYMPFKLK